MDKFHAFMMRYTLGVGRLLQAYCKWAESQAKNQLDLLLLGLGPIFALGLLLWALPAWSGPAGDAGGQAGTSTPAGRPSGRSSSQRVGGRLRAPHGVFQHFTRGVGRVGRLFRFSG
jgi:hypothetical protein